MNRQRSTSVANDPEVARARSVAYALMSRGFQYPDRELISSLADPDRWSHWPEVLRRLDEESAQRLDAVRMFLQSEIDLSELQDTYNALFGHAVRGRCPAYELEYGGSEINQQASSMADIAGFYSAFGVEVADDTSERADHMTIECEFMSILCAKEAQSVEAGDSDSAGIGVSAQRSFLSDHLACWLPAFAHRVDQADPRGWYGALARFAAAFVAGEANRYGVAVGPQTMEIRPADPVLDTTISCSPMREDSRNAGDELVQLGIDPAARSITRPPDGATRE